jgi:diaminopimelate decarboxylase
MDAGAYFVPFATSFSFPQPAIVAVDGSTDYIVRRAETFEDMNARDGLPVHAEPTPAARC